MMINANPGACHGDIIAVSAASVNASITENLGGCPVVVGAQMSLPLTPPVHATPPVVTCTKGISTTHTCTVAPVVGNHIELNENPGICHGNVTAIGAAGSVQIAGVNVTENVNLCQIPLNTSVQFDFTVNAPSTPITCPDVAKGATDWYVNGAYELAQLGIARSCNDKDAAGNVLPFRPGDTITRAEVANMLLRVWYHNASHVPPTPL